MTATATIVEMPVLFPGDDVTIDDPRHTGQIWTVHKVKRSKAVIRPQGRPTERGLDIPMELLVKTGTTSSLTESTGSATPVGIQMPLSPRQQGLSEGVLVRITRNFATFTTTDLLVITKVNSTTVSLDRIGGNQPGELGMRAPFGGVTIVDIASVLA